jgi:2-dehydropantoate 2-reductase
VSGPASAPPSSRVGPGGPRFLVVGCGGIGGIVAAHLFEQGHDVTALTRNVDIADAIENNGFVVRGDSSPGTVRGHAVRSLAKGTAPFDFILLCTQPPQVEDAARDVLGFLGPRGAMVCFQNGLCEERIARVVGTERTLGAIVAWGASMVEPGVYDRTSAGGFAIGRLDGAPDDRLEPLSRALEAIGPVTVTSNLAGARWSKLAINCCISSLGTVGGDRLGALMRKRHVRRLGLEIMSEVVDVARAQGVRLEKVSGTLDLDWIALTADERVAAGSAGLVAKHALLLAVGARYRRLRSSMLSAIERGRPPAVDFLNGEVATRGRELGVATPINAAIRDEVLAIAAGRSRSSHATLRDFFDRTRKLVEPGANLVSDLPAPVVAPAVVAAAPMAPLGPVGEPSGRDVVAAAFAAAKSDMPPPLVATPAVPAPAAPEVEMLPAPARLPVPPGGDLGGVAFSPLDSPPPDATIEAAPIEVVAAAPETTAEAAPLPSALDEKPASVPDDGDSAAGKVGRTLDQGS